MTRAGSYLLIAGSVVAVPLGFLVGFYAPPPVALGLIAASLVFSAWLWHIDRWSR